jgi:hypothetical protein
MHIKRSISLIKHSAKTQKHIFLLLTNPNIIITLINACLTLINNWGITLSPPNTPPMKMIANMGIKYYKTIYHPTSLSRPNKLVLTTLSQANGIQLIEERNKEFHLPIMCHYYKITFHQ